MSAAHRMPFGAQLEGDEARFRLWAPGADAVTLRLDAGEGWQDFPMRSEEAGWFECRQPARAGNRYAFRLASGLEVADPASRWQEHDVHGPSTLIDPEAFAWTCTQWQGRPWREAVIYELHVGAFSPTGNFDGVRRRLDYLAGLGVTVVELMPVAAFPGRRNWGYDGVLPFAPDCTYGHPDELRRLVDAAHARGLMVMLDVVYNHFGPEGNYLHQYAPQFFTERLHTPWGAAIDFSQRAVREFFIHNALYWLEEFRFDGLRLDAVHAILDDSTPHVLSELAERVRQRFEGERAVHLVLENDDNAARFLERDRQGRPSAYVAQWNDDLHHVLHTLATGESDGYYEDYADRPAERLVRCLREGFAYQGDASRYRDGETRGEPSAHLPAEAFVAFVQNHDQIGNRAFGERLTRLATPDAVHALGALITLLPSPPLLFMGEEWAADQPFLFFCDFPPELAQQVREGRAREFARFARFSDAESAAADLPDPGADETFAACVLDWERREQPPHAQALAHYRRLLALRREMLVPKLGPSTRGAQQARCFAERGVWAQWHLEDGAVLTLHANLGSKPIEASPAPSGAARLLYATHAQPAYGEGAVLAPWEVQWRLE